MSILVAEYDAAATAFINTSIALGEQALAIAEQGLNIQIPGYGSFGDFLNSVANGVATGVDAVGNTADSALKAGSGFIGSFLGGVGGLAGSLLGGLSTIIEIVVIAGVGYCIYSGYSSYKSAKALQSLNSGGAIGSNTTNGSQTSTPGLTQLAKETHGLLTGNTKGKSNTYNDNNNNGKTRYKPVFRIDDDNDSEV